MNRTIKTGILLAIAASAVIGIFFVPTFPQDTAYHTFYDQRSFYGVTNFWNVVSNLPFLIVGLAGFQMLAAHSQSHYIRQNRLAYYLFALGISLTAFGSAYYHLHPSNNTLLWDRLPMTLAFMSFFCIVISDYLSQRFAKIVLIPLIVLAASSVLYWRYTESIGAGDLRFYVLAQFLPLILIALVLLMFNQATLRTKMIWTTLVLYLVAKLLEAGDQKIYEVLEVVSGHTLKHLVAALAAYYLVARGNILAHVRASAPREHY